MPVRGKHDAGTASRRSERRVGDPEVPIWAGASWRLPLCLSTCGLVEIGICAHSQWKELPSVRRKEHLCRAAAEGATVARLQKTAHVVPFLWAAFLATRTNVCKHSDLMRPTAAPTGHQSLVHSLRTSFFQRRFGLDVLIPITWVSEHEPRFRTDDGLTFDGPRDCSMPSPAPVLGMLPHFQAPPGHVKTGGGDEAANQPRSWIASPGSACPFSFHSTV